MSHIVTYEAQFVDTRCLERCCNRNGWEFLTGENLYSSAFTEKPCTCAVKLANWAYPIYVDQEGTIYYDNYNGNWGSNESLDLLKQEYAREACYMEAEEKGYSVVSETVDQNGRRLMELVQY